MRILYFALSVVSLFNIKITIEKDNEEPNENGQISIDEESVGNVSSTPWGNLISKLWSSNL